jgi:hypothetical protein
MDESGDTINQTEPVAENARCVVLTQNRRGHGQSTLAWYLARALVESGLRVLVVDITGRHHRLLTLATALPMRNLSAWTPPQPQPEQIGALLHAAQAQTRGRVDVLLVDSDLAPLVSAGGFALPIDYVLALVDPTAIGQQAAEHLAERLAETTPHLAVVFSRANASETEQLPQQTEAHTLPVLGYFPADYLLANDESSRPGATAALPHDDYLQAVARLGRMLILRAGLRRLAPAPGDISGNADGSHPQHPDAAS